MAPMATVCLSRPNAPLSLIHFSRLLSALHNRFLAAWVTLFVGILVPASAQTATTWTATSDTTFATGGNWSAGAPVNDLISSVATFDGTGTVNPVLTAGQSVKGLSFTGGSYNFSASGGAVLTLGAGGITTTSGNHTLSTAVTLVATQYWSPGSGSQLTVSGVVSGSYGLNKNGAGTLVLSGANTYSGITILSAGTLALNSATALGNSTTLFISGGTLDNTSGASVTLANNPSVSGLANGLIFTGSNSLNLGTGGVTLADRQVTSLTVSASTLTIGTIDRGRQSQGLTKLGAGTLVVTGDGDTYSGTNTISAGTIQIGAGGTTGTLSSASAITNNGALVFNRSNSYTQSTVISGTGSVTQAGSGTTTFSAVNTYTGTTTIAAGTLALGSSSTIANSTSINLGTTASPGTLNLTAKSSFSFGSGQTVAGVGTITIGASKTVTINGAFAPGNSTGIVNVTGNLTLAGTAATTLEINTATAGTGYDQVNVSGLTTYGGALTLTFGNTFAGGANLQLFGLSSSGSAGAFSTVTATGSYSGAFTYSSGTWNYANGTQTLTFAPANGDLTISASAIPEPSTYAALLGVAALGAAVYRRRRTGAD